MKLKIALLVVLLACSLNLLHPTKLIFNMLDPNSFLQYGEVEPNHYY